MGAVEGNGIKICFCFKMEEVNAYMSKGRVLKEKNHKVGRKLEHAVINVT